MNSKFKKLLSITLAAVLVFTMCAAASAQDAELHHKHYCFTVDEVTGEATLTGVDGDAGSTEIPSEIDGYKVTAIGANAYENADVYSNLEIPESVRTIGEGAFANSRCLETLTVYPTLERIEANAFAGCDIKAVYFEGLEEEFAHLEIEQGNEILLEKADYITEEEIRREELAQAGKDLGDAFVLVPGSALTFVLSPAIFIVMPTVGLWSFLSPFIAIGNLFIQIGNFITVLFAG